MGCVFRSPPKILCRSAYPKAMELGVKRSQGWPQGRVSTLTGGHPELTSCPSVPTGGRSEGCHLQPGGGPRRPDLPAAGARTPDARAGRGTCPSLRSCPSGPLTPAPAADARLGAGHPPRWHCHPAASFRGHRRRQGPPPRQAPLTAASAEQTPANCGRKAAQISPRPAEHAPEPPYLSTVHSTSAGGQQPPWGGGCLLSPGVGGTRVAVLGRLWPVK